MKRLTVPILLAILSLPLAAQWREGDFAQAGEAVRVLAADLLERYDAQQRQDTAVLCHGDYEIRTAPLPGGYKGPGLWDKAASRFIQPSGTFIPVRMFFMDSQKGPMAGCPARFDGHLWVDGYDSPDPKKTAVLQHNVGIYRIEDGTLVRVMSLGDLSTGSWNGGTQVANVDAWAKEEREKLSGKEYSVHRWIDLAEPLGEGTEFLKLTTSHVEAARYVRGESCHYTQYQETAFLDWEGRPVLEDGAPFDGMEPFLLDGYGPVVLARRDSLWGMLDGKSAEVLIPCIFPSREGTSVWTALKAAVDQRFTKFSYTVWRNGKYGGNSLGAYFAWAKPGLGIGPYDAENEAFPLTLTCTEILNFRGLERPAEFARPIIWRTYLLKVPSGEAPAFKDAFFDILPKALSGAVFRLRGDLPDLESVTFTLPDGKAYHYGNQ